MPVLEEEEERPAPRMKDQVGVFIVTQRKIENRKQSFWFSTILYAKSMAQPLVSRVAPISLIRVPEILTENIIFF